MKRLVLLLAFLCSGAAQADEPDLDALCAAAGGALKRTEISNAQRIDCAGGQATWFRVRTAAGAGRTLVGYEAARPLAWRAALEAAVADLATLCGETPPSIQLSGSKVTGNCASALAR